MVTSANENQLWLSEGTCSLDLKIHEEFRDIILYNPGHRNAVINIDDYHLTMTI